MSLAGQWREAAKGFNKTALRPGQSIFQVKVKLRLIQMRGVALPLAWHGMAAGGIFFFAGIFQGFIYLPPRTWQLVGFFPFFFAGIF